MTGLDKTRLDKTALDNRGEKFSALIDDELDQPGFDEVVSALCSNEGSNEGFDETSLGENRGLKKKWQRYHMISDVLQKHLQEKVDYCLADRVMSELENEPIILVPNRISAVAAETKAHAKNTTVSMPVSRRIFKQIAGLAVAASVMVVAILVSQTFSTNDGVNPTAPPIATLSPTSPTSPIALPAMVTNKPPTMPSKQQFARISEPKTTLPPSFQNQLNRYLANHNQYASGVSGVLPYARIIGYTSNQAQTGSHLRFQPQSQPQPHSQQK